MGLLVLYLGMAFLGYVAGAKFTKKDREYKWINAVTTVSLAVLIFTMGARIGADERVIASLQTIGIKALIITVFGFVGSILGVFLMRKLLKIDKRGVKVSD